jgi:hypothetical protein
MTWTLPQWGFTVDPYLWSINVHGVMRLPEISTTGTTTIQVPVLWNAYICPTGVNPDWIVGLPCYDPSDYHGKPGLQVGARE